MSTASDCDQPPENTEQTETIPIVDVEEPLALPPPPPPEDEWRPIPEHTNVDASRFSFSLCGITPVILGVFSLLLLMLCGFFGYHYFQSVQESESKMKSLIQQTESLQNKEENFLQVLKALEQNKEILQQLQKQNEYITEALQELNVEQGDRCGPSLSHWVQYRDHCYHQTVQIVSWLECSDLCISLNATFLKTERSRLMYIMKLLAANHTWLGLSYNEEDNQWKWVDGSLPSPGLSLPKPSTDFQGNCVYANVNTVGMDTCTMSSSCVCEKPVCAKHSEES
ncbi:C-type lectin domain family 12 member B-like isoform X1 [Orcinus orca]|uniref:C-type lectin domain family 12 member B-like isoform X1 n=1 Tax=Orcinus orca TaxID=9733 RepID=UPI00062B4B48|nr:C-type lectin domain family 12 member B-like isoform X1 [Orcinus orca]XP_033263992.1 C-type lectin domain family 12 member B-like isoform X1 [Orcinus orca]XP_049550908.1 C-type lectin domain family 12 member B-like isoform X1 [Orcinus orca]XP_049550909.1 C-type lectin domain family 12 member B-like isoform X1 [Orcinus orca]